MFVSVFSKSPPENCPLKILAFNIVDIPTWLFKIVVVIHVFDYVHFPPRCTSVWRITELEGAKSFENSSLQLYNKTPFHIRRILAESVFFRQIAFYFKKYNLIWRVAELLSQLPLDLSISFCCFQGCSQPKPH